MRIKSLFMAFLTGALALAACKKEQNPNDLPPSITVSPGAVSFEQSEGSQKLEVTATRAWTISGIPEWIAVTPASGAASLTASEVIVSVLSNTGNDREATLSFSIGLAKQAVTVKQKGAKGEIDNGKGTKESPYSVAGAVAFIQTLGADVESTEKIYIKGKISVVSTTFEASGNYGNASFDMVDAEGGDAVFKAFQTYYLGNRKWKSGDTDVKEGDEVIIYGPVVNYKGNTPETVGKGASFIYSLNGKTEGGDGPATGGDPKGSGTVDDPFNVAAAINAVKDLTWTSNDNYQKVGPYYVKGKVSSIKEQFGAQFGNGTFDMVDEGTTATFTAYRILYLGNKKWTSSDKELKEGDEVVICAELMNYRGNTPETVQNSGYLYSLNGETGGTPGPGGDPKGTGSQTDPYNVAAAINAVKNLTWTSNDNYQKTGPYYVKGKISKIADKGTYSESGTYGNATFYISDDGSQSNEFYCYRILYLGNKKYTSGTDIKVGDEVIIYGELMNYRGNTPETVANACYLYSLNGVTGGDDPGPGPSGDVKTVTVAEFIAAAESSTQQYKLTGTIGGTINSTYGNFDLTDDSGTVYVYGLTATNLGYGATNDKSYASLGLQAGDKITIIGYRGSYGEKIEVVYAYFVEKVSGGDPGPGPSGDVKTVTVAEFNAAAESSTQKYKLTGTIGGTINSTYGNFDLTDDSGTVYVYGLTATDLGYGATNDKSYASLGLQAGDKITIIGYRGSYGEKIEVVYAYFVEKVSGGDPGPGPDPGTGGTYDSNVTWTAGTDNAYDQDATVNGTSGVKVLKLGKAGNNPDWGKSTLTLPAGSSTLSFYAVSWNNADVASLVFSVNGKEVATVTPKANSGLAGNPTYTLTVSDSDYYTVNLGSSATTVEVKTTGGYRAALFGIVAQ